jgi:general secretion pathway protein G
LFKEFTVGFIMQIHNRSGFTLIELLVVATILAVLAAGALVSYASVNQRSRDSKRMSDLEQLRSALEMSRADTGSYITGSGIIPSTLGDLVSLGYIDKLPRDPKQSGWTEYSYISATGATYNICARTESIPVNQSCDAAATCGSNYNYCVKNP